MGKKIYKYFSAEVLELIFKREGFVGIKCSLPNQYNDPYELFLGVDRLCCTNRVRDSSRESSVVAGLHEQTYIPRLQDPELARI